MSDPQKLVPEMFRFTPTGEIPGSHELTEVEHLMVKLSKSFSELLKLAPSLRDKDFAAVVQDPSTDPAIGTALRRPRTRIAQLIVQNYIAGRMPLISDILYTKYPSAYISRLPALREFTISAQDRESLDRLWSNVNLTMSSLVGVKRPPPPAILAPEEEENEDDRESFHWPPPLPEINDYELSTQVFTHRSANISNATASERTIINNERLEFKGDTTLGEIIVGFIYREFPLYSEGDLTKLKSLLVSNLLLRELSILYNLPEQLKCSKEVRALIDDSVQTGKPCKLIADLFEAYVGGVEVNRGYDVCRDWLLALYKPLVRDEKRYSVKRELDKTAKVELHRLIGADLHKIQYNTTQLKGGQFSTSCTVDGEVIGVGVGNNKRDSSSAAAMDAMSKEDIIRHYSESRIATRALSQKEREARAKLKRPAA